MSLQSNTVSHWLGANLELAILESNVWLQRPISQRGLFSGYICWVCIRARRINEGVPSYLPRWCTAVDPALSGENRLYNKTWPTITYLEYTGYNVVWIDWLGWKVCLDSGLILKYGNKNNPEKNFTQYFNNSSGNSIYNSIYIFIIYCINEILFHSCNSCRQTYQYK